MIYARQALSKGRSNLAEKSPPCVCKPRRGISPLLGATARQCPFCISILTSVRRIVKIAVRFSHTKTALCDRCGHAEPFCCQYRTQHCVCRDMGFRTLSQSKYMFQCRTQHCVCRDGEVRARNFDAAEFQCRTQHCVCRDRITQCSNPCSGVFQCRTQHCVCRDSVSRSPCPVRAEKAFWKDETAECGFAPVPEHSPFPSSL